MVKWKVGKRCPVCGSASYGVVGVVSDGVKVCCAKCRFVSIRKERN